MTHRYQAVLLTIGNVMVPDTGMACHTSPFPSLPFASSLLFPMAYTNPPPTALAAQSPIVAPRKIPLTPHFCMTRCFLLRAKTKYRADHAALVPAASIL